MEEGAERDGSLKDLGRGLRRSAYRRESPYWNRDRRGPDGHPTGPSPRRSASIRDPARPRRLAPRGRPWGPRRPRSVRQLARPDRHRMSRRVSPDSISMAPHDVQLARAHLLGHTDRMEPRDGRGPATSTGRRGSTHVERDSARVPRRCVPPDREGARHRPGPTIARMGDGDRADRLSRQWTHVPSFSPLSTRTGFPSTERVTWASPPSPRKTTVPSGPT